ncbi:DNA/RNA helicase domain-containing protein [Liquorilactobacillus hordei]|uniref:DNA/RNA helicase domain-containing protein n=1 Tax=Liquorilactobacillus hordei TaxID=468911 RepID=UPI001CC103B0|nr:DNA/RNA helicase domain-containing protein [Liquorilactobacillus hordei]
MKKYISLEFKLTKGDYHPKSLSKLSLMEQRKINEGNIIYIYLGKNNVYIGQTKHFLIRNKQHFDEDDGNNRFKNGEYERVIVAFGSLVTQGSLDDIERKLITYITADRESRITQRRKVNFKIDNGTRGNIVYEPYEKQKDVDCDFIKPFWEELFEKKYVVHKDLSQIKTSLLFKYSPFFVLSKEQQEILDRLVEESGRNVVYGMAGTGKTVIITNLAARLSKLHPNKSIAVVGKTNWIKSGQEIFEAYGALNVTISTAYQLIKSGKKYDYILVDEAHRLRQYYSKGQHTVMDIFRDEAGNYSNKKNELDFLLDLSENVTIFYDPSQSIRPGDIPYPKFQDMIMDFKRYDLTTEYRINVSDKGARYSGDDFIKGILSFLQIHQFEFNKELFSVYTKRPTEDSYFGIVESVYELFEYLEYMENFDSATRASNRVVAGYARPWISHMKKNKGLNKKDWVEGKYGWCWNSTNENWLARKNSRNEIGSIHAVQGIDLSYVGVIIANDISITENGKIVAVIENYKDTNGIPKKDDLENGPYGEYINTYIKNIYYTLLTRGIKGIRVYFENKELEKYFKEFMGIK